MTRATAIVGVDTGGTFTDLVAFVGGRVRTHKVLSTPANPAEAVLRGLKELLGDVPAEIVTYGSTVATNALLERRGARVVLLTTAGFEDLIEIGRQNRPSLYELEPRRPQPLVQRSARIGIAERTAFDGEILIPLSRKTLDAVATAIRRLRPEAIAVCFLHSYGNPQHERAVGRFLRRSVDLPCSLSHELVSEYREYERLSTTVINAYVRPVMSRHLGLLQRGLKKTRLRVMQSNGGAISAVQAGREAVRTVLSGPAGGVIGAWRVAQSLGIEHVITFDMGGTSTDVSLIDGAPGHVTQWEIGDLPIKIPALEIHTVGAGGGSLASVDNGGALKVGPQSAGADPGPACYGKGVEATVTDANVLLGRLVTHQFLGGAMQLDAARARRALTAVGRGMQASAERAAEGVIQVANASMERAIRRISVERGRDPRKYTLIAFGGAAGQHACDLAANLGIRRVIAPAHPGLLSAWGGAAADVQRNYGHTVRLVNPPVSRLRHLFAPLDRRGRAALRAEGILSRDRQLERSIDLRYQGQSYEICLPLTQDYLEAFHLEHARLYGYADRHRPVEVVNLRLVATGRGPKLPVERRRASTRSRSGVHRVRWGGRWLNAPMFLRDQLRPGARLKGPAIIVELSATTFVPPDWSAALGSAGQLEMLHGD
jgi:N-methylhydantoinase A